jgi:hypothetical protein
MLMTKRMVAVAFSFVFIVALASVARPQQMVTVAAGTPVWVRMVDTLDTNKNKDGDRFTASLDTNLAVGNSVVVPRGATVHGRVKKSNNAGRFAGKSELQIELTDVVVGGTAYPILTGDVQQKGKSEGGETAKKTIAGAGLGAIIGGIAGNAGMGAAIGAVSGVGLSATKKGQPIVVPSETLLEFRLEQPAMFPGR